MIDSTMMNRIGQAVHEDRLNAQDALNRARVDQSTQDTLASGAPYPVASGPQAEYTFGAAEGARLRFVRWMFSTKRLMP